MLPGSIGYLAYRLVRQNCDCSFYVTRRRRCTIISVALTVHAQFFLVIQLLRASAIFFLAPVWCSVGKLSTSRQYLRASSRLKTCRWYVLTHSHRHGVLYSSSSLLLIPCFFDLFKSFLFVITMQVLIPLIPQLKSGGVDDPPGFEDIRYCISALF